MKKPRVYGSLEELIATEGGPVTSAAWVKKHGATAGAEAEHDYAHLPRMGRPPKGAAPDPATAKAVRQPASFWRHMRALAEREGKTLHEAMREAVVAWVAARESSTSVKRRAKQV